MNLTQVIDAAIKACPRVLDYIDGTKTVAHYQRVLSGLVSRLYNNEISVDEFVDSHADLIAQQFRRAWNEGMRANGLDPATDMTAEWEQELQNLIADEYQYVDDFAADIVAGASEGKPIDSYKYRAGLWAARYAEIVNTAKIITGEDGQTYTWHYGDTVEHCNSCAEQAGQTRTAKEWRDLRKQGIYPQSRSLECHGYNCHCTLKKG